MKNWSFLEGNYVPRKTKSNLVKRQNYAKISTELPKQRYINHAELLEKTNSCWFCIWTIFQSKVSTKAAMKTRWWFI